MNYDFYKYRDINYPATGKYSKISNIFTYEGVHLKYDNHSYIILEIFNNRFKKN